MPRTGRLFEPDSIYHVTLRGVERRSIFINDEDRQWFSMRLLEELRKADCSLFGDCLMGNHTHSLIGTSTVPLGVPLQKVHTAYAMRFNGMNERVGHLFQSRFFSKPVHDIRYLQNVVAYIHDNPVRAKLVTRMEDWKWSSHAEWNTFSGTRIDFDRLAQLVGISRDELQELYALRQSEMENPGPKGQSAAEIVLEVARMLGIDPAEITAGVRGQIYTKAKGIIIAKATAEGISNIDLAEALGCTPDAIRMHRQRSA